MYMDHHFLVTNGESHCGDSEAAQEQGDFITYP